MNARIQQIAGGLPHLKDLRKVYQEAEQRLADGDAVFVADLAIAVEAEAVATTAPETWQYDASFKFLLRLLATTPGRHHVEQALRALAAPAQSDRKRDRFFASVLAASQSPEDLSPAFTGGGSGASEEMRACLVHEFALRRVAIDAIPAIRRWAESPHWRHHPLGMLPSKLAAFEKDPALPQYSARGSGVAMPFLSDRKTETVGGASHVPAAAEVTDEAFSASAATAVQNWVEDSNGRIEVRAFDLAEPIEPNALPELLRTLDLESSQDIGGRPTFPLARTTAAQAWRLLFAAASSGGAYNRGHFGAYGRLYAWRSIAAMAGTAAETSPAQLEQQVEACSWFDFSGATPWFERVAWDIGLVAVSSDSQHVTVLAATDTD